MLLHLARSLSDHITRPLCHIIIISDEAGTIANILGPANDLSSKGRSIYWIHFGKIGKTIPTQLILCFRGCLCL